MHEVAIHAGKACIHALQQVLAHADQGRRSAWRQIEAAQKFLRARTGHGQPLQRLGTRLLRSASAAFVASHALGTNRLARNANMASLPAGSASS